MERIDEATSARDNDAMRGGSGDGSARVQHIFGFCRSWHNFTVGDASFIATGVVAAIGLTAAVTQRVMAARWLIVALVIVALIGPIRRGAR